jgi:hypothetical protein
MTMHFARFFNVFVSIVFTISSSEMVKNWQAYLDTPSSADSYKAIFEWDHVSAEAVVIGHGAGLKPTDDPRCSGDSQENAADGQPYWMPRFFSRPVSEEIKQLTGIQFASVDWQPCGHKDITICHGESHYDFHLYYTTEEALNSLSACDIGTRANPRLPVCEDSQNPINAAYFKLINQNMPVSAQISSDIGGVSTEQKNFHFCVDETSAILRSGVHYGDKSETLKEWKTPVTIIGSHDCELMFFEPMMSWKWISGSIRNAPWPYFKVENIQYNTKTFEALPHTWSINVSEGCKTGGEACHIKLTVEGTRCPAQGCSRERACGQMVSCTTGQPYSPSYSTQVSVPGQQVIGQQQGTEQQQQQQQDRRPMEGSSSKASSSKTNGIARFFHISAICCMLGVGFVV